MKQHEWARDEFLVSCDPARLDHSVIAEFLGSSYWAAGIPAATLARSLANSLCFGLFERERQIGLARIITDYATIAYLGDVFVLPDYRGRGLSKWLMECVVSHPELLGLRRWLLVTADAHGLYSKYGFTPLRKPDLFMERHDPEVYRRSTPQP